MYIKHSFMKKVTLILFGLIILFELIAAIYVVSQEQQAVIRKERRENRFNYLENKQENVRH